MAKPRERRKRPTIQDVARRAGVTTSTVSRILNKREMAFPIAEETRQRVLDAVKELGYRPNRLARSLALSKTYVVGVSFPITEPTGQLEHQEATWLSIGSLISGIQHVTQMEGYEVHIFNRIEHDYPHPNPPREFCPDFIDGLIYVEPNPRYDYYSEIAATGVPLVTIGPSPLEPPGFAATADDRFEIYRLTKALIAKGHHRIALFLCTPNEPPLDCLLRMEGYRTALQEEGIPFDPALMPRDRIGLVSTRELVKRLFNIWPRPTAMIIGRPEVAHYFLEFAQEKGLECPRDIEFVVLGDDPTFAYRKPSLTTLKVQYVQLGEAAARLMLDIVEGKIKEPKRVIVPWQFIQRESCVLGELFDRNSNGKENQSNVKTL